MTGRLAGQVVFVTGGARGQGRTPAEAAAREGAGVVLFDRCADAPPAAYPLATPAERERTAELVRGPGREALTFVGDVRDEKDVTAVVEATLARIDVDAGSAARYPA